MHSCQAWRCTIWVGVRIMKCLKRVLLFILHNSKGDKLWIGIGNFVLDSNRQLIINKEYFPKKYRHLSCKDPTIIDWNYPSQNEDYQLHRYAEVGLKYQGEIWKYKSRVNKNQRKTPIKEIYSLSMLDYSWCSYNWRRRAFICYVARNELWKRRRINLLVRTRRFQVIRGSYRQTPWTE